MPISPDRSTLGHQCDVAVDFVVPRIRSVGGAWIGRLTSHDNSRSAEAPRHRSARTLNRLMTHLPVLDVCSDGGRPARFPLLGVPGPGPRLLRACHAFIIGYGD